jgi:hypothetical protein
MTVLAEALRDALVQRDALKQRCEKLEEALAGLVSICRPQEQSPSDFLDVLAERFYRDTGVMAPFKSEPLAMASGHTEEDRHEKYDAWIRGFVTRARAALKEVP